MIIYDQTKDPSETRDFTHDWSNLLASGESVSSIAVSIVTASGTTSPSNSVASNISRVWLTGGTAGERAIWTIAATTNQGRTFEESFGVDIVDSTYVVAPATELERLQAHREMLLDAKDAAVGGAVVEVWNGRYGNKMKYQPMTYEQICLALDLVNREIAGAEAVAAGHGRRRPINLAWTN